MRRWALAPGWTVEPGNGGLALAYHERRNAVIPLPAHVQRDVLAYLGGSGGPVDRSPASTQVLTALDRRGVLTAEVVRDGQALARHLPGVRDGGLVVESGWVRPARLLPPAHLRFGHEGPELAGSRSGDRVLLMSDWAVRFCARLIARTEADPENALETEMLSLFARARLLRLADAEQEPDAWEFHDSIFHAATRLDTSPGAYGAKLEAAELVQKAKVPRPPVQERVALDHEESPVGGMTLREAISSRATRRDHGGPPIGRAELSAVLDASLRIRRIDRTATSERAWCAVPTGGAVSGLSAVVVANVVSDLERGAYEYDAVTHQLAPVPGPAPAIDRWLVLAQRLTGIPSTSVQAMILLTLYYARPAHSYDAIVYATALKEVGAALEAMALTSVDRGLSFCPMGGGFATTAGLGDGVRSAAVVGEAVLGRPGEAP
jgi:SagB-type dehydrogenase family enzyme